MSRIGNREAGRAAFREREPPRRGEPLWIGERFPRGFASLQVESEIPRRVAVQLLHRAAHAVRRDRHEELPLRVPETLLDRRLQRRRFRREPHRRGRVARPRRERGDRPRLAAHRRVHERTRPVARKREFGSLVIARRLKKASLQPHRERARAGEDAAIPSRLPRLIVPHERGQVIRRERRVTVHVGELQHRVGDPADVRARSVQAATVLRTQPKRGVVPQRRAVTQPAPFANVVAKRTTDRVVPSRPADVRQKLRDDPPVRRVAQMLAIRPPAEIIRPLNVRVRTREARRVLQEERLRRRVRNGVRVALVVRRVERPHVVRKRRVQ